jgi:outer membrane beta-barrel protein
VIDPQVARRTIKVPRIDNENIEIGGVFGALSIEDFGTNPVYGVTAAYHVTEDFFFQAEAGRSTAGKTSFETLGGNIQLLTGDERQFTYYNLALGYNFLPGEVFLGRGLAMTSGFYLLGGIGSVEFAGDQKFTVSFGAGYRVLPTDWLAIHVRMQDRIFDTDLLGESKLTNNLEANIGLTVFF